MASVDMNNGIVQFSQQHMNPAQFQNFLQIADFLGVPNVRPNLTICKSTQLWDLWELWTGFNKVLSDFLQEDIFKIGSWITRLFPREDYTGGTQGTLIRYVFESQVLDEVPDQSPNTILEAFQEKHEFSLVQRGSSFVIANDFMYAPNGPEIFAQHCRQLERSLDNTIAESVLTECIRVGAEEFVRKIRGPLPQTEFWRTITRFVDWFAAYQKTPNGADKIESKGHADLLAQGIAADTGICPATSIRYFKNVDVGHTVHARGGDTIYDKRIDTEDKQVMSVFHGILLHESRAFKQPQNRGVRDPFFQNRTVGEFYSAYPIADEVCPTERYKSVFRQIVIGDAQKIKSTITLNDMVTNCAIFDPQDGSVQPDYGNRLLWTILNWDKNHCESTGQSADGWTCPPSERLSRGTQRKRKRGDPCTFDLDEDDVDQEPPNLLDMYNATGLKDRVLQVLNRDDARQQSLALKKRLGVSDEKLTVASRRSTAPASETKERPGISPVAVARMATLGEDESSTVDTPDPRWTDYHLKQVMVNLQTMRTLIAFNLYVPLGFLLARPRIVFTAGSYLLLKQGRDTGVIYTNRMVVELTRNGKNRTIGVNLNFASQTVIQERKNFAFFPDVFVTNYHGGYGSKIHDPRDAADNANSRDKDIFVFAVPYHFRLNTPYLDITGFVNNAMLQTFESQPEPMVPTLPIYRSFWNFPESVNLFLYENWMDQAPGSNTFCIQGWQQLCIPKDMQIDVPTEILGQGHMGQRFDNKTMKVFRGEDDQLTNDSVLVK